MLIGDTDTTLLRAGTGIGDTMDGGAGNDRFQITAKSGDGVPSSVALTDITGSDTVDFQLAGTDGSIGVTFNMDLTGVPQLIFGAGPGDTVTLNKLPGLGQTTTMPSPFESFVGSVNSDTIQIVPLAIDGNVPTLGTPVYRSVDGNTPTGTPTGDTLIFDGHGQTVLDSGSVLSIPGLGEIAYQDIENPLVINQQPRIIDNGDPGFVTAPHVGSWATIPGGYENDQAYTTGGGTGSKTATYTFTGLQPGTYQLAGTWPASTALTTVAPYTIFDGTQPIGSLSVDQSIAPHDFQDSGASWKNLGEFTITGHTLVVQLSDAFANPLLGAIADALRVERVSPGPSLSINEGPNFIGDDTTTSTLSTLLNVPTTKIYTLKNEGTANLVISEIDLAMANGAPFTATVGGVPMTAVTGGFDFMTPLTLLPGGTANVAVTFAPSTTADFDASLRIFSNDVAKTVIVNEGTTGIDPLSAPTTAHDTDPFTVQLHGSVVNSLIIDNGQPGFGLTGNWTAVDPGLKEGYLGTESYHPADGSNDSATWTFTLPVGQYRVSATWFAQAGAATTATYSVVAGTAVLANTGAIVSGGVFNQTIAPSNLLDQGVEWQDLFTPTVGGTLNVTTAGTVTIRLAAAPAQTGYVLADAVRVEPIYLAGPAIAVTGQGAGTIADDTGTYNFGTTDVGVPLTKTFTVTNNGQAALTIQEPVTLPTGYTLVQFDGLTPTGSLLATIAPGNSTTFQVRLDAGSTGALSGQLAFATNEADKNPFNFQITGTVNSIRIIDNSTPTIPSPGYSETGTWVGPDGDGYQGNDRWTTTLNSTATWQFAGLPAGFYLVSVTYHEEPVYKGTATAAPFTVSATGSAPVTTALNQQVAPASFTEEGVKWQNIGEPVWVSTANGTITVILTDTAAAGGIPIADAMRIERLTNPTIGVFQGTSTFTPATQVMNNQTNAINLGMAGINTPLSQTFTIMNYGITPMNVAASTGLVGYTVTGLPVVIPGANVGTGVPGSTTFTVTLNSPTPGTFNSTLQLSNDDINNNPFDFPLTAQITAPPTIIDDSGAGFTSTAGWVNFVNQGQGFGSPPSLHYAAAGTGSQVATWTFTGLANGLYRLSTTWTPQGNRATNAPYTILDGATTLATVLENQQLTPSSFTTTGTHWQDLGGPYRVTNGTLTVQLTDNANAFVIADAMRLEALGGPSIQVLDGTTNLANGTATDNFGNTTLAGGGITKTFTVRNNGTQPLTLSAPTLPFGYSLVAGTFPATLTAYAGGVLGQDKMTFQVQLNATQVGPANGQISFANNDPANNPFHFNITGSVTAPTAIIDDSSAGFASTSGFSQTPTQGYDNGVHFAPAGTGTQNATWTFNLASLGLPNNADYRVSATWTTAANRATNAPYQVFDGTTSGTLKSSVALNQQLLPNELTDAGVYYEDLGTVFIASGVITVKLSDVPTGSVLADAVRIEQVTDKKLNVQLNGVTLDNGQSTVDFGTTTQNVPTTQTITIQNTGAMTLTLGTITLPAGFSFGTPLPAGYTLTNPTTLTPTTTVTLAANTGTPASLSLPIQFNATATGATSGQLTLISNDPTASAFHVTLQGTVNAATSGATIIDDSNSGFTASGFTSFSSIGYLGELQYAANTGNPTPTATAAWVFNNLIPGTYQVSATWVENPNRATNAPFTVRDGALPALPSLGTFTLNQQAPPGDYSNNGTSWTNIGGSVTITGTSLRVELGNNANGFVIADAVRLTLLTMPTTLVTQGSTVIRNGVTTVPFASAMSNIAVPSTTFTVTNTGVGTLVLGAVTAPTGFVVTSPLSSTSLAAGASATFQVALDTTQPVATYNGLITFTSGGSPFTIPVTGTVTSTGPIYIADDASPATANTAYADTGFIAYPSQGYLNEVHYSAANTGKVASWTFTGLPAGSYRVSVTYSADTNRATNAPFTVSDGPTTVGTYTVNEKLAPSTFTLNGVNWQDLSASPISISSGTLIVSLNDNANGFVIADAVRIERLGPQLLAPSVMGPNVLPTTSAPLTQEVAQAFVNEAARRWNLIDPGQLPLGAGQT